MTGVRSNSETSSSGQSSMNVNKFIQETDRIMNGSVSTSQTSIDDVDHKLSHLPIGSISHRIPPPLDPVHSVPEGDNERLNSIPEESMAKIDHEKLEKQHEYDNILQQRSPVRTVRTSSYQDKLAYHVNKDFNYDQNSTSFTSTPSSSIPNTFKNKSHPNAKTKTSLGLSTLAADLNETGSSDHEISHKKLTDDVDDYTPPIKTSTIKHPKEEARYSNSNADSEWMPSVLNVPWNNPSDQVTNHEFNSSVRINKKPHDEPNQELVDLNLEFASGNTILHNSKFNSSENEPQWKRVTKAYNNQKESQLQNIFLSVNSHDKSASGHDGNPGNSQSLSSTISTPMVTLSNLQGRDNKSTDQPPPPPPPPPPQQQQQQQQQVLNSQIEEAMPKNPESPLKLYSDNYNTYTKGVLSGIVNNFNYRSKQNTPIQGQPIKPGDIGSLREQPPPKLEITPIPEQQIRSPKSKIKMFTKSGDYTEEKYLQNADNIFKNIKKRGFKVPFNEPSSNNLTNTTAATATSTPKVNKIVDEKSESQDEYSSFSTVSQEKISDAEYHQFNSDVVVTNNEYTSFDHSSKIQDSTEFPNTAMDNLRDLEQVPEFENESSYTFEDVSDENGISRSRLENLASPKKIIKTNEVVSARIAEQSINNHITQDTNEEETIQIKWKRPSQLRLSQGYNVQDQYSKPQIIRGRILQAPDLPIEYENMKLDVKNHKWMTNDDKENFQGSLDSIEDLVSNSEELRINEEVSNNQTRKSKLEVSFHLPNRSNGQNEEENEEHKGNSFNADITRISQVHDMTFTQTRQKLVSLLTDIISLDENLSYIPWKEILDISISGHNLESVKDLDKFLPHLRSIDLSENLLTYLDGIPSHILNLELKNNRIQNLTPFYQFHDLQSIDISNNEMVTLSNFSKNIHLREIVAPSNQLVSLSGINILTNLTKLDVTENNLKGTINFEDFELPNLQELKLSRNNISAIKNLENLPQLRLLYLDENQLIQFDCEVSHINLKKLSIKSNKITELDLIQFPSLRVLRVDGNPLNVLSNLRRLKYLEELSIKSQNNSDIVSDLFNRGQLDIKVLDLSGNVVFNLNSYLSKALIKINPFLNVNVLRLSAMNLTSIPDSLAVWFPNLRELDLNFNMISNLDGLSHVTNLRKLNLLSNKIEKFQSILMGIQGSRLNLRWLDLRLNPCTVDFYPFVFVPHELSLERKENSINNSPIPVEGPDEIDYFVEFFKSVNSEKEWSERDTKFVHKLLDESNSIIEQRFNYETLLINYLVKLRKLDGGIVDKSKRMSHKERLSSLMNV